ncbi:uncharacterized protein LOC144208687 isoform X2 [Stigmatopora nigra]
MGRYKCAYDCESSEDADVKYFKFPLCNERRLKKWLANMKWKDWTPSRFSVLCSKHFEEQHLDRTGKCVQLREDAIPTIFLPQDESSKSKTPSTPKGRKKSITTTDSQIGSPTASMTTTQDVPDEEDVGDVKLEVQSSRWMIIMDESLMKITSLPHFFHGDYCTKQDVQWAPDTDVMMTSTKETDGVNPTNVIEVTSAWQWLGLDVRGPLPTTQNGHKYLIVAEALDHFGLPLKILSRLPCDVIGQINQELAKQLMTDVEIVVQHSQTGAADPSTQNMIDRMVRELADEHETDWDVFLPAKVFALCFQEHSQSKKRPFELLCCRESELIQSPPPLHFTDTQIQESALLVRYV